MALFLRNVTNRILSQGLTATRFRKFANIQPPLSVNFYRMDKHLPDFNRSYTLVLTGQIPVTSGKKEKRVDNFPPVSFKNGKSYGTANLTKRTVLNRILPDGLIVRQRTMLQNFGI